MTLSSLEADLYRRLGYASSPATTITTRLRAFLNETQNEILSEPGMGVLLNGNITFASVADTPQYSLPPAAARVKTVYEITNDRRLTPRSLEWYRSIYPDVAAVTGTPEYFVDLGLTSIATQPASATEVFVDSTSASDNTQTAYVEGYRTNGYFRTLSVAMNGTTGTSLSAAITDFVWITKFYISAAAVGSVTLQTTAAGGTVLSTIPIGGTYPRYRRIALVPTPSAAVTYTTDFEYDVQDMSIATDEPIIPPRFHRMLLYGTLMKEYDKKDDTRYEAAAAKFTRDMNKLKFYAYAAGAGAPNLRGRQFSGISQLGGQYPAGS